MGFLAERRSNLVSRGRLCGCYVGGGTRSLASDRFDLDHLSRRLPSALARCKRVRPDRRPCAGPRFAGGVSGYPSDDRLTRLVQPLRGNVGCLWRSSVRHACSSALGPDSNSALGEWRSHADWAGIVLVSIGFYQAVGEPLPGGK